MGFITRCFVVVFGLQFFWVGSSFAQAETQAPKARPAVATAPATQPPPPVEQKRDYTIAPSATTVIEQDSSAYHRIDKQYQLTAILFGIGPSLSGTYGLQGSYFLSRNKLILVEVTGGKLAFDSVFSFSGSQAGSTTTVKTQSIGVHFKQFTGNSFYYRVGVDFRRADYDYSYFDGSTTDYHRFKGTSMAANFQIGNQWQWSSFTLGCDWIGVSVPLTSNISDEQVSAAAPSSYADWQKTDEDTLVKNTNLNLLRFYLGASF